MRICSARANSTRFLAPSDRLATGRRAESLKGVAAETGCAMVVIEHDMTLLSTLCDRLVALELGRVISEGTPAEVLSHPEVIASYLGTDDATVARSGRGGVRGQTPARRRSRSAAKEPVARKGR